MSETTEPNPLEPIVEALEETLAENAEPEQKRMINIAGDFLKGLLAASQIAQWAVIIFILIVGWRVLDASMEADIFNARTGKNVTTWEAFWIKHHLEYDVVTPETLAPITSSIAPVGT